MKKKLPTLLALQFGLAAVVAQPVITNQPVSQTNIVGATATFSVGATGTPPLSYQWVFNGPGNRLPGATNVTLILPNVQASNAGVYRVTITNAAGSVQSGSARLTVVTPPVITPANPTASLFADLTLLATNISAGAISHQWLFNGEPIAGAVTNRLVVTNVQKTNAGNYAIVVTYAFGSATSQVATLKIVPFNSMYCFGFSWTDTHNCTWPAQQYYMNRGCNGPMWPEFLSTNLGLAYAESNNYARCGATASNALQQVINLPVARKPELSIYYLWAADSDFFRAFPANANHLPVTNAVAWHRLIDSMILDSSNAVARLYAKGGRAIIVSVGEDPGDPAVTNAVWGSLSLEETTIVNAYYDRWVSGCTELMESFAKHLPELRLLLVSVYSKLKDVYANPLQYGFTKTSIAALDDPLLMDKSFAGPGADYLFWDSSHPTSKTHKLIARWHSDALTNAVLETVEPSLSAGSLNLQMNHLLIGRDYTLQTSSDLASWNDFQTFTASAGTNQINQTTTGETSVFYRLRWQH